MATTVTATTITPAATYKIDPAHSEVTFQVRHLLTKVRGRFGDFAGRVRFDEQNPAASGVDVSIRADSIDTQTPDRDAHLRSGDFFDVANYPELTFQSVSVVPEGDGTFNIAGNLTIHGVTRPVTLPVSYLGKAKDPWGNERAAFEAELTINRKDFGLNWNAALETGGFLVGDDVKIALSVQAVAE